MIRFINLIKWFVVFLIFAYCIWEYVKKEIVIERLNEKVYDIQSAYYEVVKTSYNSTLLVLNGSKEIISRYKRVYKIKIPIFPCDEKLLSRIMEEFNTPFAFISDKDKKIMHLYNEKTKLPFDEYFQILKRRYSILKKD